MQYHTFIYAHPASGMSPPCAHWVARDDIDLYQKTGKRLQPPHRPDTHGFTPRALKERTPRQPQIAILPWNHGAEGMKSIGRCKPGLRGPTVAVSVGRQIGGVRGAGPSEHPEPTAMQSTHAKPRKTTRNHGGHHAGPRETLEVHALGGFGVRGDESGTDGGRLMSVRACPAQKYQSFCNR